MDKEENQMGEIEVIFSLSLYGNNNRYINPLMTLDIERIKKELNATPVFQIYCNNDVHKSVIEKLKDRGFLVNILDFSKSNIGGMFARYLPIIEGSIEDTILVRDTDCDISSQEISLINYWLQSKFDFHVIRGHPLHIYPIMGGLFAIRGESITIFKEIYKKHPNLTKQTRYNSDQLFLNRYIYPVLCGKTLIHTTRVAYAHENFKQIKQYDNFIGETHLHDRKREIEKNTRSLSKKLLVLPQIFAKISIFKPFNRIVTWLSLRYQ